MARKPEQLKQRSFRLSDSTMRKLDLVAKELSENTGTPMNRSDAIRHLINNAQYEDRRS